jgi:lipoyl(octanoyl) transferase
MQVPSSSSDIHWRISDAPVAYDVALSWMKERATAVAAGREPECVWLLEHPPLYSAGTSARSQDLLTPTRFPVHETGRGGQYTYHGPGQRIAYVMLDVRARGGDVRLFVGRLEAWIITTLAAFNVRGETRAGRVGVWVARPDKRPVEGVAPEDKIAAIGIRVSRGISLHGISLNVEPDLEHFSGIVPCGIREHGVTSLVDLGLPVTMADVDIALRRAFDATFGVTTTRV